MLNNISCSWIDPPTVLAVEKIPKFSRPIAVLKQLEEYHRLPKDKLEFTAPRCASLLRLSFLCASSECKNQIDVDTLQGISKIAENKRRYLWELNRLHRAGVLLQNDQVYDRQKVSSYFNSFANRTYDAVKLNNTQFYDSDIGIHWGEFWLEAIDPAHRQLDNQKDQWLHVVDQKDKSPFFLWLEGQVIPRSESIKYFSKEEQRLAKLSIADGKICDAPDGIVSGRLTTDPNKEFLFIVDADEDFYGRYSSREIRHPSLTRGTAIIAPGMIQAQDGEITVIESNSGHYLPDPQTGLQLIAVLRNKGAQFSDQIPFHFFQDFKRQETTVRRFENEYRPKTIVGPTASL
ncbi:MAG: hypothetical protein PHX61_06760 [Alphaproteobacteria bacterium]|nr:hypothetical protein [Alphaproteobacteria bacterium]